MFERINKYIDNKFADNHPSITTKIFMGILASIFGPLIIAPFCIFIIADELVKQSREHPIAGTIIFYIILYLMQINDIELICEN